MDQILIYSCLGMRQYCDRYGETIYNVSSDFGPIPKWEGATEERIVREMNEVNTI